MKEHKILGFKSHDCHVLLQHLLSLALQYILPKLICELYFKFSLFFKISGINTLWTNELEHIKSRISIMFSKLEMNFPLYFFM